MTIVQQNTYPGFRSRFLSMRGTDVAITPDTFMTLDSCLQEENTYEMRADIKRDAFYGWSYLAFR
jgi:hypothetical protein